MLVQIFMDSGFMIWPALFAEIFLIILGIVVFAFYRNKKIVKIYTALSFIPIAFGFLGGILACIHISKAGPGQINILKTLWQPTYGGLILGIPTWIMALIILGLHYWHTNKK